MSIASIATATTAIASPSIVSAFPSRDLRASDVEIIRLGAELETSWSIEREAWERLDAIDGEHIYAPLRVTLAYDANSAVDRHIASLLMAENDRWNEETAPHLVPIERLRNMGCTGDENVDRRIKAMIAASEQWTALAKRPKVSDLYSKADAAASRTIDIVHQIEGVPAHTIEGLKVKALALRWCYNDEDDEIANFPEGESTDVRLARSIFADLRTLDEARANLPSIRETPQTDSTSSLHSDPIYAAIEAQRHANEELCAHLRLDEALHDDDLIDDLLDNELIAVDVLFRTPPQTRAGREALIRQAIQVIDQRTFGDRDENSTAVTCGQLVALLTNLSDLKKETAV